ncbi:uncharacterized protein LOC121394536 [Xenopus laevis]|uniref:Gypsy retrotransposon integrase-like protein 1 n=1 Tax=Xenopus laevis TaxID=8355 RepID=A0A8J1KWZ2_XENLA|nr:uncharacterized protein LOC121394536 [Xenopus laevis]
MWKRQAWRESPKITQKSQQGAKVSTRSQQGVKLIGEWKKPARKARMSKRDDDASSRGPSHDSPEGKEEIPSEAELLSGAMGIATAERTVKPKAHILKASTEKEEQPTMPETIASLPPSGLDELLKWMVLKQIESDQKHKVEEQRWRQDEAKRREEEQRRFQQEAREHREEMLKLQQMQHKQLAEILQSWKAQSPNSTSLKDLRLTKLTADDDIESYITMFERVAQTCVWPKEQWVIRLAPYLTGKAQKAYSSLNARDAQNYDCVKDAIFRRYELNAETFRQRFRTYKYNNSEGPREAYAQLYELLLKWIQPEKKTGEEILEIIALEQLVEILPEKAKLWVQEHRPETSSKAIALAEDFLLARRDAEQRNTVRYKPFPQKEPQPRVNPQDRGNVKCHSCGKLGHIARFCHKVQNKSNPTNVVGDNGGFLVEAHVNGQKVQALLDSGSPQTLLKAGVLRNLNILGNTTITCVHGDKKKHALAKIQVKVGSTVHRLIIGLVPKLPYHLIIGRDFPNFLSLLPQQRTESPMVAVTTRAQAKQAVASEETWNKLFPFSSDLFEGQGKPGKTKREKRLLKAQWKAEHNEPKRDFLATVNWDIDIEKAQRKDSSLLPLFRKVVSNSEISDEQPCYVLQNCILIRVRQNKKLGVIQEQVVVPKMFREEIIRLAHETPWSGHMGREKTLNRILYRFFWPGIHQQVAEYCSSCPVCQKTAPVKPSDKAPLIPIPVVGKVFERVAMDIVGPLEKSSKGNQYILVVCDYATRYPEAIPLRNITAKSVADALIKIFSSLGIPREILTDQGTNFTSSLLKELYALLGVKALRTAPYHPQTDGLVERMNQTLKRMLKKFVEDDPKHWDRWLPYLLFAYREVPQASTGYSPFELLYGRQPRGILDVIHENWVSDEHSPQSVIDYIDCMRQKLCKMSEMAQQNLADAQSNQSTWYNKRSREQTFKSGEKVLLLLPSQQNKLMARWQGPFQILRQVGPVDYEIQIPGRRNKKIYHVNLLRKWKERKENTSLMVLQECSPDMAEEAYQRLDRESSEACKINISSVLTLDQQTELGKLLDKYNCIFVTTPGRTNLIEHVIDTGDAKPIRQQPYRMPEKYKQIIKQEVMQMLEFGVIEPSVSNWCSPVVLVPKKDSSIRFCVDFRKINLISKFDSYPMPRIDELIDQLGGAKFISTIDLSKGYWQIPLDPESREKTAFATSQGLFQFVTMPFGLHGAPATFQRLMDRILRGHDSYCSAYLDDVVIFSPDWQSHLRHLDTVVSLIKSAGLTINPKKCALGFTETRYLGYILGNGKVKADKSKIKAIAEILPPKTKKEVRSFLGLVGYYRRFLPNFSEIAAPLTDLTKKNCKDQVIWNPQCEVAFQKLKDMLCTEPVLKSPNFDYRFIVQTDASEKGLGAVLSQEIDGEEHPVLYISRKLFPRETRYSVIEKECLAIKWALESLRCYLLGQEFSLVTDHHPLIWINRMKDKNARVTRWYLAIQPFRFTVHHRPGSQHHNADYLSRYGAGTEKEE